MTLAVEEKKVFKVGTLGWTADDLDDPKIERLWERGRYEIVEGVLTEMPAAQLDSTSPLFRLLYRIQQYLDDQELGGSIGMETDLIVSKRRVAIVDAVYLSKADVRRQARLYAKKPRRRPNVRFGRLTIAPTLVIESLSVGHEAHDLETKYRWYAEAGVRNYWVLDCYRRSLKCYVLAKDNYRLDTAEKGPTEIRPSLFPGLVIPLAKLWL
jgi:Uma2 family endonuclease